MALARARRERSVEYWPGFVDALSTLVLGIVFLLSTFVVVQFYLSQEVTGKDTALARLNAQIAELMQLLSMEKTGKASLEDMLITLGDQIHLIKLVTPTSFVYLAADRGSTNLAIVRNAVTKHAAAFV